MAKMETNNNNVMKISLIIIFLFTTYNLISQSKNISGGSFDSGPLHFKTESFHCIIDVYQPYQYGNL